MVNGRNPRIDPTACDECGRWLTVRCSVDGHKGGLDEYLDPLTAEIARLSAALESADRDSIEALESVHRARERAMGGVARLAQALADEGECPFELADEWPPPAGCEECGGVDTALICRCWSEWALCEGVVDG